jgi:hypothetical protein
VEAPAVRPGTVLHTTENLGAQRIATAPDGRVFVAESYFTGVYTADLAFLYEFQHPRRSFESRTNGIAFDERNGTLWWHDSRSTDTVWLWNTLLEGDTLGNSTGRQVDLPHSAGGLSYDAMGEAFFYSRGREGVFSAVDTGGVVLEGYPVSQTDYSPLGNAAHEQFAGFGTEVTGPFLETAVLLINQGESQARRVVVTGRDGRDWGAETPLPAFPGFGTYATDVARGRGTADTVLYLPVRASDGSFVAAVRAAPLPPAWLRPDTVRARLGPGETWPVRLTVDARGLAPGTYTAAVRAVRTAGALQQTALDTLVTVPVVLEVGPVAGEASPSRPLSLSVAGVYPNPLSEADAATAVVALPEAGTVRVVVYDVLGRAVAEAEARRLAAGRHAVAVPVSGLAPGLYVVRVAADGTAGAEAASGRLTVVR